MIDLVACLGQLRCRRHDREVTTITFPLFVTAFFLIATFPTTWLLMLFLGNVGLNVGYWGTLPLDILASDLLDGATATPFN